MNASSPNAAWRSKPATAQQWKVLQLIGRETGRRFPESITRGEASVEIGNRFASNARAARGARRAKARRKAAVDA